MTIGIVIAALGLILLMGADVCCLIAARRAMTREDWLDAPFLGIAAIVIPLQNGFYFGLPVRYTAGLLLVLGVALAIRFGYQRRFGRLSDLPIASFGVAAAAYVIQGAGLFIVGVDRYLGRAWSDQFNYVAMAEFILRYPASAAFSSGLPPFAIVASPYLSIRIGQSVLLAFLAAVLHVDTKTVFEPVILLCPFLVVVAVSAVTRALEMPRPLALVVAAIAGVLPALAYVQLESFLSQSLAIPLLIYVVVLAQRTVSTGRTADFLKTALVVSALASVYLELFPFAFACLIVMSFAGLFVGWPKAPWLLRCALVIVSPLLFNVVHGVSGTLSVMQMPILGHIYPWAFRVEGLERLWLGDLANMARLRDAVPVRVLAMTLTLLGYGGLLMNLLWSVRAREASRTDRGRRLVLALSLCGLAAGPLAVAARDLEHPYQFYKLLLSVTPLFAVGIGVVVWALASNRWRAVSARVVATCVACLVGIPAFASTASMAIGSARWVYPLPADTRYTGGAWTLNPAFADVQAYLERLRGREIVMCAGDDTWSGGYLNAWMGYFARENRVWSLNHRVNDQAIDKLSQDHQFDGFPSEGTHGMLLATDGLGALWADGSQTSAVWQVGQYQISEPATGPFVLACHPGLRVHAQAGAPGGEVIMFPDEMEVMVLANRAARASLAMRPADPLTIELMRRTEVLFNGVRVSPHGEPDGGQVYDLAVQPGLNRLQFHRIRPIAPPAPEPVARFVGVRFSLDDARQDAQSVQ